MELPSARPPLRVALIQASALVEDAAERFRAAHPATPLRLLNGCDGAAVEVDRMMLRRALDNLLDNAVKHSDARKEVVLEAKVGGAQLTVEVRDRGPGIPAEDMRSIFTPFFRADRSRARQTGGLGLGFLLARRIVEAHHGALEMESEPGHGTVARIRIPTAGSLP